MDAPFREAYEGKRSKTEPKSDAAKDAPKGVGAAPSSRVTEVPDPPWKRKPRREAFEGDIAAVELRSSFALRSGRIPEPAVERIPEPAVLFSTAPKSSGVLPLMSGVAMAAAAAGVAGYLWGFKLSTKMPELTPVSGQASVLPALSAPVASPKTSNRNFDASATTRMASVGLAPVDTRGAADPAISAGAGQRPAPSLTPPQTVSPSVAPRTPVATENESVIAAKMKIGVELMTYGEVIAARTMFQRAAEAGDAAGAFALAETYDPLVLGALRLRERIMPDAALARTWYEKARDLGSPEARDRISRLAQLPQ
jgi:hypothetical protein